MRLVVKFFCLYIIHSGEVLSQSKVNWIELDNNTQINNNGKKMIIDLYTDWCGWCKVMDRNTFTDSDVISHINNNFVAIKFDAEYQNSVTFNNNLYKYLLDAITGNNSYENIDIPLEKTKKQNINSLIESIQEELNL